MTAPVPVPGDQSPVLFTATYQTKQFDTSQSPNEVGINGGFLGVLGNLADPPATGTAAEGAVLTFAQEVALGEYVYDEVPPSIGTT